MDDGGARERLQEHEADDGAVAARALLLVQVGHHRFALPADAVVEVHRVVAVVPIPDGPEAVDGVICVRGTIVPVIDARARLGETPRPPALDDHLVLVRAGDRMIGIRVDRAVDLVAARSPDVSHAGGPRAGVLDDALVLVHDVAMFARADEMAAVDVALGGRGEGGRR